MTCLEEKEVFAYLREEMSEEKLASLENHTETCDKCASLFYRVSEKIKDDAFLKRTLELVL
ncbi:MAG: hypothetical protein ACD_5C00206G0013 [uncultured bacterium]|nr:MAG: hypothetical protein ACD_5C00206G0013 [uncultured bacterium]